MFASVQSVSSRSPVDFTGAELAKPFEFPLDRSGVKALVERVRRATPASVSLVRVGLEAAGHYHLPLAGGVLPVDWVCEGALV